LTEEGLCIKYRSKKLEKDSKKCVTINQLKMDFSPEVINDGLGGEAIAL
jgi:hypothetical protein